MSRREMDLLWLKDVLEQLSARRQQLEWAEDPETVRVVAESMIRDLDCCRRLCESLHQRGALRQAV
ncbi:MAG: hypothetical protein IT429_12665 [Gemmataceae bacterium]|nr:hypothetical protein [Gemmataceae bacterium]